jgi:glycosyltransferase involved in cell wall biosynthesis
MEEIIPNSLLDVVIPVFNGSEWIESCIAKIHHELTVNNLINSRIIVVNDGSTDGTEKVLSSLSFSNLTVINQENLGRLLARKNGASASTSKFILFLDVRVELSRGSLEFVLPLLRQEESVLWTCDVEVRTQGNPIARFWRTIELVAWRSYYKDPRLSVINPTNFDYFPKGTGALISERELFLEATENYLKNNYVLNSRKWNDDTAILRYMTAKVPMKISPQYKCTYHARSKITTFLHHANHRGTVLIDGHWRKGARFQKPITFSLYAMPLALLIFITFPVVSAYVMIGLLLSVFGFLSITVAGVSNSLIFVLLLPVFAISYYLGMCYGAYLRLRGALTHRRQSSKDELRLPLS